MLAGMKPPTVWPERVVDSPRAALFFADSAKVERLFPFMEAERSLAEAARRLKLSTSLMSYWVKVMLRLGLLETARVEKRGRHKVPVYRATASSFRVPLECIPKEAGDRLRQDLLRFVEEPMGVALTRLVAPNPQDWHVHCYLQNGQTWLGVKPNRGSLEEQKFIHQLGRVRLSERRAEAFRREIRALLERYGEDSGEGRFYLYQCVLVEE